MSRPVHSFSTTLETSTEHGRKRSPVLVPNSAWGSSKLFGRSDTDREGSDYGRLAVELLQLLYREYPTPIALDKANRSIVDTVQFNQIWNWLFDQHIVSGSPASGALTVSGMRAFHSAIRQFPHMGKLRQPGQDAGRASHVMLAMLRAHVFNRASRSILT